MADLDANGNVINNEPNHTHRMKSNATDIRRTIAPEPTVIGTKKVIQASGFTNANNAIFGDGDSKTLNSGILLRSVEGSARAFVGITAAGLATTDCFLMEDGDDLFIPTNDFGKVFINTAGATLSVIGE